MNDIIFILFSAVAVSYGWGMRGTIIGGEKGAMLPGALMGLLIALFSESEVLISSPWILAGAGALSMYCGGCMTYGETLHLSMGEKNSPTLKKGLVALFIKGGIWFGIFGGLISFFISAIAGFYELWEIILFFSLLPVFASGFYFILNHPHNPEENKFPKIYFSVKRKESWGGLFGILVEILLFAFITKDYSALAMTSGAFLSGAVGWVIAQIMQIKGKYPNKNGKHLFDKLYRKNALETWKLMECTLGAFGGIGCSVTFILSKPLFSDKFSTIDNSGFHSYISEIEIADFLAIIYFIILCIDSVQYVIKQKDTANFRKYKKFCTNTEFAIYSIIPLILGMLGSHLTMLLVSVPVLLLVLSQELAEKKNKIGRKKPITNLWKLLLIASGTIFILLTKYEFGLYAMSLLYSFVYEWAFFDMKKIEEGTQKLINGEKTVHAYFTICCVLIMIMTFLIQGEIICLKT